MGPDDLLDLYARASEWALDKVRGAAGRLDTPSTCERWDVATLMDHMLDTERYFAGSARGQQVAPPSPEPPRLVGTDPVAAFEAARTDVIDAFSQPGVIDKTGVAIGIAFADQLLHGWDLARSTGQDTTMPEGLAQAAYEMIHGRFTEDQREGVFKPEVGVPADAPAQDRLLAYTGRDPR